MDETMSKLYDVSDLYIEQLEQTDLSFLLKVEILKFLLDLEIEELNPLKNRINII